MDISPCQSRSYKHTRKANAWTDTASAHVPIGSLMIRSSENSTVVLVGNGKA